MEKIKISAVSYLNTYPFLYGIYSNPHLTKKIEISTDYPSVCAQKLIDGNVDLGLVPVAVLPQIKDYSIISDYCISAFKQVKSVMLFSDVPLNEIKTILLDYQSRTSVNLAQILASEFWHISPVWQKASLNFEKEIKTTTAAVLIGDRALNRLNEHKYVYDLAEEWFKFTQLPFVFATWTSNKKLPEYFVDEFNESLRFGINHIDNTLTFFKDRLNKINYNAKLYLTENIDFMLNKEKQSAIDLFLKFLNLKKEKTI